jgi:hypothetical protein
MIFYPPETDITDLGLNCAYFKDQASAAYHYDVNGSPSFAYAVIPTCKTEPLSEIEHAAAHELIEAATDPQPALKTTWAFPIDSPWQGEVGDLCDAPYPTDGHTALTVWSNAAAKAGGNPCVPDDGQPYFNVSVTPDQVHKLGAGDAVTLDVTGWSTGPLPDWTIMPFNDNGAAFDPAPTLSAATINNGGKATLTVSVPDFTPSGASMQLVVWSQSGKRGNFWPIVIQVP